MNKRAFGSVRRLPSGRWQARYQDPSGRVRAADHTFLSKSEATRWLTLAESQMLKGEWLDPDLGQIRLDRWSERWMASRADLKPKTRAGYASLLRSRILPIFGQRPISGIRPLDVQEWIAGLQVEGVSPSRIRQAAHLLGAMMKDAVASGLVATNPCQSAKLPRMPRREMQFFTAGQVESLTEAIAAPYGVLVLVLAYGGLRFGEAAALRQNACDLLRGRLIIRESLADVSGKLHFGPTKTHQRREVVLPSFLQEALGQHLDDEVGPEEGALVFSSPEGQPLRYSNFVRRFWSPALSHACLPQVGVHVLRHTCASLLIAQGAPVKAIQAQLGHASAELTLTRYGHLYPDDLDALAARLDEARASIKRSKTGSDLARICHDERLANSTSGQTVL